VLNAGDFFLHSMAAAQKLKRRAVLLIGPDIRNRLPEPLPPGVVAFEYAPHSTVFPRAAAIVHQGGIGTTAQAMRAGRPSLVVPFGFDQPDNAARVTRMGIARTLPRRRYVSQTAERELHALLTDPSVSTRAGDIAVRMRAENGAQAAADAILRLVC
jgi:UDP:flavonoid glycosyltransferase YjiC (YdhE family)